MIKMETTWPRGQVVTSEAADLDAATFEYTINLVAPHVQWGGGSQLEEAGKGRGED